MPQILAFLSGTTRRRANPATPRVEEVPLPHDPSRHALYLSVDLGKNVAVLDAMRGTFSSMYTALTNLSYDDAARDLLALNEPNAAVIIRLFVPPNDRHRGLGAELVRSAFSLLRQRGVRIVYLAANASPGFQEKLVRFYESLGFQVIGRAGKQPIMRAILAPDARA